MRAVGRYRLEEELGRGAAGSVFRALDPEGRRVALKLLHPGALDGERQRRRFEAEVRALLRVRHPQVATLLDAGSADGQRYLALEQVQGTSLARRLDREGPLEPRAAVALVGKLAEGLQHCHEQGVLHRDLKPDNVLLRASSGEPVLVDFGLARDLDQQLSRSALTVEGTMLGSPGFWAPEQARGELGAVGPWTDVYGLGGVLFAALTGEPPNPGSTLPECLAALMAPPPVPSTLRPDLPAGLDAIVLRCLAREPAARLPDAGSLARELQRFLDGRTSSRPALRPVLALGVLAGGLAVTWAALAPRPSSPQAPAGGHGARSPDGPRVAGAASAAGAPTQAGEWARRWAQEAGRPAERGEAMAVVELTEVAGAAWARLHTGQITPAQAEGPLKAAADAGSARAQRDLGRLRLRQARVRDAAEAFWRASRPPLEDPRGAALLAHLLAVGAPDLPAEPDVARRLLRELEDRTPLAEWPPDVLAGAATVWWDLAGPGELGRGLRLLEAARGSDALPPILTGETEWSSHLTLAALGAYEGWCRAPSNSGLTLLVAVARDAGSPPAERALARRWLGLAALAGNPECQARLRELGEEVPAPEAVDPWDVIGLDRSRAVAVPIDAAAYLSEKPVLERLTARLHADTLTGEELRQLRALADHGSQLARWELGVALLGGTGMAPDPRSGLVWAALAALDGPGSPPRGLAYARLRVGRSLVLGEGCPACPAEGLRWLESARARESSRPDSGLIVELWLGLARFVGWGQEPDPVGGLQRLRAAMVDATKLDALDPAYRIHARLVDQLEVAGARAPPARVAQQALLDRYALRRAAHEGDALAQATLERLADASDPAVARRFAFQLGLLHAEAGRPGEARRWLDRSAALGKERARLALEALDRGEPLESWIHQMVDEEE